MSLVYAQVSAESSLNWNLPAAASSPNSYLTAALLATLTTQYPRSSNLNSILNKVEAVRSAAQTAPLKPAVRTDYTDDEADWPQGVMITDGNDLVGASVPTVLSITFTAHSTSKVGIPITMPDLQPFPALIAFRKQPFDSLVPGASVIRERLFNILWVSNEEFGAPSNLPNSLAPFIGTITQNGYLIRNSGLSPVTGAFAWNIVPPALPFENDHSKEYVNGASNSLAVRTIANWEFDATLKENSGAPIQLGVWWPVLRSAGNTSAIQNPATAKPAPFFKSYYSKPYPQPTPVFGLFPTLNGSYKSAGFGNAQFAANGFDLSDPLAEWFIIGGPAAGIASVYAYRADLEDFAFAASLVEPFFSSLSPNGLSITEGLSLVTV